MGIRGARSLTPETDEVPHFDFAAAVPGVDCINTHLELALGRKVWLVGWLVVLISRGGKVNGWKPSMKEWEKELLAEMGKRDLVLDG